MREDQLRTGDPQVAAVLSRIIAAVRTGRGQVNPGIRLVSRSGDLSLACAAEVSEGEILVSVPRELLMPTAGLVFEDSSTELRLTAPAEGLSDVQQHLLDLQIELYNLTEKVPQTAQNHPLFTTTWLDGAESALESLRGWVPKAGASAADVFLSTRVLGLRSRSQGDAQESDSDVAVPGPRRKRVLMPIIDLANHHPEAMPFGGAPAAVSLQVSRQGDQQCFAKYAGRKDLLDLALHYGYLDRNVTEAVSGRFAVEVEQLGRVEALGRRPKRKSELDPPLLEDTSDGLKMSHLMFDEAAPSRFWATLTMAVQMVLSRRGQVSTPVGPIVESIAIGLAQANIEALQTVGRNASLHSGEPAAGLMVAATKRQAEIITNVVHDAV